MSCSAISVIAPKTRIAYIIPEFPGQTHIMFWRERAALHRMGVITYIVSTRRPPRKLRSHNWAHEAQRETFYLSDVRVRDIFVIGRYLFHVGPNALFKIFRMNKEGLRARDLVNNFVAMLLALRLVLFMQANNLTHAHCHSCANAALIAFFSKQLGAVTYSLTLHGDLRDYGSMQELKWQHASFGIVITERLLKQVHEQFRESLLPTIGLAPMGVDSEKFRRVRCYEPWTGDGPIRLFSCGRLNFTKGHQDLIKAVAMLRRDGMDVRLEIAGEDEAGGRGYHRQLDDLIGDLHLRDSVVLLGALDEENVLNCLNSAHLFVLASHQEPLGVAIMEAMSCGTPVVATNLGGVPELIEHNVNGYLIPPKDPKVLADAIRHVVTDHLLIKRFCASARSRIVERFSSCRSAGELVRLLGQLNDRPT